MPKKKPVAKKSAKQKTFLEKVGNAASHIKDDVVAGKDHLVEFAGDAFHSIKEGVKHLVETGKKKKIAKKKTVKKVVLKKAAKKIVSKKTAKKAAKKVSRKK